MDGTPQPHRASGASAAVSHPAIQEIVAVFGQPVAGNPTQYLMEKAFAQARLDWRYLTLEVAPADLHDAIRGLRAMNFRGCNITIPHKVEVIQFLDRLSDAAQLMGAVNCVIRQGDELIGENTDGKGFLESLTGIIDPRGKHIVILGSGGAARAIAVELALGGATEITIVNRGAERGGQLADLLSNKVHVTAHFAPWEGNYSVPHGTHLLVNATSIGMGNPTALVPLELDSLHSDLVVADVVFNPPHTRLLAEAQQRGCRTVDGLGMLVNQAIICFKLWTGLHADREMMRDALEEFLGI
jgi:shikimate dehydrogenase